MNPKCDLQVTEEQKAGLQALSLSPVRAEADRARAILWTLNGKSSREIGNLLGVNAGQVRVWRRRFRNGGVDALRARKPPGRPISKGQVALEIATELLEAPRTGAPPWTLPRLAEEIRHRKGITISVGWLSVLLRKKGGFRFAARDTL